MDKLGKHNRTVSVTDPNGKYHSFINNLPDNIIADVQFHHYNIDNFKTDVNICVPFKDSVTEWSVYQVKNYIIIGLNFEIL